MTRSQKNLPIKTWAADRVFAAAVAAHQSNGEYLKYEKIDSEGKVTARPNKVVMRDLLDSHAEFTVEQCEQATKIRQHYQGLLFEQMAGELKEFLAMALKISTRDHFHSNDWLDLAVVASLPNCYERDCERRAAEERRLQLMQQSHTVGKPGDRVQGQFEVVQCRWSNRWRMWTVNAQQDLNLFFFFHNTQLNPVDCVELRGTVKCHRDDAVTQLNRVKIINAPTVG